MQEVENYNNILKREGLKSTKHRNSILKLLENCTQPVTAEQIFLEMKEKKDSINLSSVYRILESLVSKKLILKSSITGDVKALFELNRSEHKHHFICTECKTMISVKGCPLEEYERQLHDTLGLDITGHKLEIFGYCKECRLNKGRY